MLSSLVVFGFVAVFTAPGRCCRPQEYTTRDGQCCPLCHEGTVVRKDCSQESGTRCGPCETGTFMDRPNGLSSCRACSSCMKELGLFVKNECRATSDTVCDVLPGYFCKTLADDTGCQRAERHKTCEPGERIKEPGTASTDTDCSDCSDGTYSDGTFTSCQQHTQCEVLLKAGTASADAECGGQSSHRTRTVIIAVVLLFLLIVSILVYKFIKRKKELLNTVKRITTAGNQQHPAGEQETETLNTTCPQQVEAVDT